MKKTIAIFIMAFMLLGLFVGCVPQNNTDGEGGSANGGNAEGGVSTENSGGNTESSGSIEQEEDNPPEGEKPSETPETPERDH